MVLWRVLRALRVPGAWFGAALWALHPVMVESVAWISELKNTESGLFFLLSCLFFLKWRQSERKGDYALTLLFAALAMASKSSTVILPLVMALCAWWMEGCCDRRTWFRLSPVFLFALLAGIYTLWTQNLAQASNLPWTRTWPERFAVAGDAVWFYLGKLAWPFHLIPVYPRWQIDTASITSYLPLVAAIVVGVLLWLGRRTWLRAVLFAFAYFLIALLPVLNFADNTFFGYSLVADHFQYLAAMGPLALVGAALALLSRALFARRMWLAFATGTGILGLLGAVSNWQATIYENESVFWTYVMNENPSFWLGYNNLGVNALYRGEVDEAIREFNQGLVVAPDNATLHLNLGQAYLRSNRLDEAIDHLLTSAKLDPKSSESINSLGDALLQKGELDLATDAFQKAWKLDPKNPHIYDSLGNLCAQKGKIDESIELYRKALDLDPRYATAHYNLAVSLAQKGALDEAAAEFKKVLEITPSDNEARTKLTQVETAMKEQPAPAAPH